MGVVLHGANGMIAVCALSCCQTSCLSPDPILLSYAAAHLLASLCIAFHTTGQYAHHQEEGA